MKISIFGRFQFSSGSGLRVRSHERSRGFIPISVTIPPSLLLALLSWAGSAISASAAAQIVSWGFSTDVPSRLVDVRAIAAGDYFSLALKNDGTLVEWDEHGLVRTNLPSSLTNVVAIAVGGNSRLALRADGTVSSWGNIYGVGYIAVPSGPTDVVAIAAAEFHNLALKANGKVAAWGSNDGTKVPPGLTDVVAISAGFASGLALKADGTVAAWGGFWSGTYQAAAVPAGLSNVIAIAAGANHNLALQADGTVVEWDFVGTRLTNAPPDLTNVVAIAAGGWHSLALKADGTVVSWGWNQYGQTDVPPELTNVASIAAGDYHNLALLGHWTPTILVQPASQHRFTGRESMFSVVASSSDPLSYQWRFNGRDIPGATNSEFTLPALRFDDAGDYSVVVGNALGSETSQPATLTVTESPPIIVSPPASQALELGGDLLLQVLADGSGPLRYEWRFNGLTIPGATNSTLAISNAPYGSRGIYTVVVQNQLGSVTSDPVQVFLLTEQEFAAPQGPLLWDFSGTYSAPLSTTLRQQPDGTLLGSDGSSGHVSGNGASVGLQLQLSDRSGYWINFSSTHIEYILQRSWTTALSLDYSHRFLNGTRAFVSIGQEYEVFLFTWAPYRLLTTNRSSSFVSQALPDGIDGRWRLAMAVVPNGNEVSGQAQITLVSSNVILLGITGTKPTVTRSVLMLQNPPNLLNVVAIGPELTVKSLHGMVAGQSVDYDAPVSPSHLTLLVNGHGKVSRFTNQQALVVEKDYSLTATPDSGHLFSNWVIAGLVVTDPTLRFTMSQDLVITANFGSNIFLRADGAYNGLFYETTGVRQPSAGFFTLTIGSKGAFSGYASLDGGRHSFSGRFDLSGQAQVLVRRGRKAPLTMELQLDHEELAVHGNVSDGTWTSELIGDRNFSISSEPSAPYEGVYTLSIPGDDSAETFIGDGFAKFWIDYYGRIHAMGTLADGTHFSRSTKILHNGLWPLYLSLYSGKGSILGWINFTNRPVSSLGGEVIWFKPPKNSAKYYSAGFTNQTSAIGSPFLPPHSVKAHGTVAITNGVVILAGGNLPSAITNTFDSSSTATGTNRIALKWNVISGAVSGSFIHPATGRRTALDGVLLQNQNGARGFFLGTNQSGRFILEQ